MQFNEFELKPELLRAITDSNYLNPTEIQEKSLPILLEGKDLIGQAATGTGKTASFVLPMLQRIQTTEYKDTKCLVLTPTRELAQQITDEIRKFSKYMEGIRTVVLFGGVPINKQITELKKGSDIIVACPGRLIDHLNRHTVDLDYVDYLVLDEADEMLNMGFKEDIDTIVQRIKEDRQTMLFSATMPQAILDLATNYLKEPETIKIQKKEITATTVKQIGYECAQQNKKALLMQLLELMEPELTMVFCNTKKKVDELSNDLISLGYPAGGIHGDMKQESRTTVLDAFKNHKIHILVCTDVAARGLDIQDLDMVFNYDLPQEKEYYIHRIGRTGRAGKEGLAISLITPRQKSYIKDLKKITKSEIEIKPLPSKEEITTVKMRQLRESLEETLSQPIDKVTLKLYYSIKKQGFDPEAVAIALLQMNLKEHALEAIAAPVESDSIKPKYKATSYIEISIGKKEDISAAHIVSAIAEATGLSGQDVGKIKVNYDFTLAEIPAEFSQLIIDELNNTEIKGIKVTVKASDYKSETHKEEKKPSKKRSPKETKRTSKRDSKPERRTKSNRSSDKKNTRRGRRH